MFQMINLFIKLHWLFPLFLKIYIYCNKERGKMGKILDFTKNLFLDVFASIRGFIYGFLVIGLAIVVISLIIYLFLFIQNIIW